MVAFHLQIFEQLRRFLQTAQLYSAQYAQTSQAFTRRRKLDLSTVFLLIVGLLKKVYKSSLTLTLMPSKRLR